MTTYMPAVVAFEEGGDYIHWFPFVILEYDEKLYKREEVQEASYAIERSEILPPELGSDGEPYEEDGDPYYEDFEETEAGVSKIENAFAKRGIFLKVHLAERMTYIVGE